MLLTTMTRDDLVMAGGGGGLAVLCLEGVTFFDVADRE